MAMLRNYGRAAWSNQWRLAGVGATFFGFAVLAIETTRFDGGLSYIWIANAFLIATLIQHPRRKWGRIIAWCAPASMLATGLLGAGWALSPFLAAANMGEALSAAWLLRRARSSLIPLGSARWTLNLLWAGGIVGPLVMGTIAMLPMWFVGQQQPAETLFRVLLGHGLSNMTFVPVFKLFMSRGRGGWRDRGQVRPLAPDLPLFALLIGVSALVFLQQSLPLLFLPILPLTAIVFRGGSRRTASAIFLLAAIGGVATLTGHGPGQLVDAHIGHEMQFFQFYLLTTVLTVVPIAAQLRSRRMLTRRVRDSEARYRMLADHSSDIITHTDLFGRALFVSPSIARIAGYSATETIGRDILELIDPADHALVAEAYGRAIASGEAQRFEYRGRLRSGEWRWFESLCRGVPGADGRTESLVSIVRDISERKQREEELASAARTDALTGIANRRAFGECAARISADQRIPRATLAVLDIDHFKQVNDRFGHAAGDEVLRGFATVAQQLLRQRDVLARLGGEEFAILFPGLDPGGAVRVCERIRAAVGKTPFVTAAGRVDITLSGGVAPLGEDGLDAALRRADQALYEAKARGRDRLLLAA